jgi:hypothetical protein
MITITIPLEEYFELRLKGLCSYIVLDANRDHGALASLTAQPDWQTVAHLEEIHHDVDSGGVFPMSPECGEGASSSTPLAPNLTETTKPKPVINQRNLVKLWPLKEYKASAENLFRAREESAKRVKAHNDYQRRIIIARAKLLASDSYKSGKLTIEKIEAILANPDSLPAFKVQFDKIVLPTEE